MEDSTDTIIISEIGENVEGKDFVEFIKKPGPVKIGRKTGQQMAMMATIPSVSGIPCRVGIVTYDTTKNAENAVSDLQGLNFKGRQVNVQQAEDYLEQDHIKRPTIDKGLLRDARAQDYNTAWLRLMQLQLLTRQESRGGAGGKGGKVTGGFFSFLGFGPRGRDGHAGEAGQDASEGGRGGKGGRPAVS